MRPTPRPARALVVGAGPTGLSLALQLVERGVLCTVIDGASAPSRDSRATAVHARTLEVLGASVAAELVGRAQRLEHGEVYEGTRCLGRIPLTGTPSPYPFSLGISQALTEDVLREHLERRGVTVQYGTTLVGLEQLSSLPPPRADPRALLPDEVAVSLRVVSRGGRPADPKKGERRGDGARDGELIERRFDWVVGCDGARSTVREQAGITRTHVPNLRWWYLADARVEGDVPSPESARVFVASAGVLAMLPLERPGWRRLIALGPPVVEGEPKPALDLARLRADVAERCPFAMEIVEHGWLSTFRIHEHVAHRYRNGRVLIAGDAAHAHSPLGGQGMNTGIQDATNLAWKLALVMQGRSDPTLLDSYDAERRPVAEALVSTTSRGTTLLYARSPALVWLRNRLMQTALGREFVRDKARTTLSMLGLDYTGSPIVEGTAADNLGAGRRAPLQEPKLFEALACGHHIVVARDDDQAHALAQLDPELRPLRLKLDGLDDDVLVVRPDGYIGFRGRPQGMPQWWSSIVRAAEHAEIGG